MSKGNLFHPSCVIPDEKAGKYEIHNQQVIRRLEEFGASEELMEEIRFADERGENVTETLIDEIRLMETYPDLSRKSELIMLISTASMGNEILGKMLIECCASYDLERKDLLWDK